MPTDQLTEVNLPTVDQIIRDIDKSPKNTDPKKIYELRAKGLSWDQVGKQCDISKSACLQMMKRHGLDDPQDLETFKSNRGNFLANKQRKLLSSITDAEIKAMHPYQRIVGAGILYDKERLETGQSTSNVSQMTAFIELAHQHAPQPVDIAATPDDTSPQDD